jgi:alpha-beta hydrolase superfamily lysophospholipase
MKRHPILRMALAVLILVTLFATAYAPCECASENSDSVPLSESDLIDQANDHFWDKEFACAKISCQQLLDLEQTKVSQARLLVNLAICDAQLDNWELAAKEAKQGVDIACSDPVAKADGLLVLGRCQFVARKINDAREKYKQSLEIAKKEFGEWNCDLAPIYEGMAACEFNDNNMELAKKLYQTVAELDYLKYGPDDTQLAWSLLSLTNVLEAQNEKELAHTFYKKVFWNFRHQNEERIIAETKMQDDEKEKVIAELRRQLFGPNGGYENRNLGLDYITKDIPQNVAEAPKSRLRDFNNWFVDRIGRDTAPGLAFFDPRTKLKALIVTIHGLGLHHGAYTPFAEKVQHGGFGVISFDVRGFGSYRNDEIYQQVDFKAILIDLRRILSELRQDYKNIPIFVLGESMGGAIALRIASLYPELVDGVVSSVPSGSRFHARSTAIEVAVKYLKNSHQQFNIGDQVVNQATKNAQLRLDWEDDPKARMNFSARDLIRFQNFMNDNMFFAEKIKTTPVIIFQGYSDELVKPLGTLALYQAIKSKDKDLMFIGHSEHLIFEQGQFDQDVVDGCLSWLDKHIKTH